MQKINFSTNVLSNFCELKDLTYAISANQIPLLNHAFPFVTIRENLTMTFRSATICPP